MADVDLSIQIATDTNVIAPITPIFYINTQVVIESITNISGSINYVLGENFPLYGNVLYDSAADAILNGELDMRTANWKVLLLDSNYRPAADHDFETILLYGAEIIGQHGYTAGGVTLTGVIVDRGRLWANNVKWYDATFSNVRWALLYVDKFPEKNLAVAVYDFGISRSVTSSVFSVLWGVTGGTYGRVLELGQKAIPESQKIITS